MIYFNATDLALKLGPFPMLSYGKMLRSFAAVAVVALSAVAAPPVLAARLLTATVAVNGETVLESAYDDDGHPAAAEVWTYLAQQPLFVERAPVRVNKSSDELRINYKGAITIRIQQSDRTIVEAKSDRVTIVRASDTSDQWHVPVEELDRIAAENGLQQIKVMREERQGRLKLAAGAIMAIVVAGGVWACVMMLVRRRRAAGKSVSD